jgi:hypothetical protein
MNFKNNKADNELGLSSLDETLLPRRTGPIIEVFKLWPPILGTDGSKMKKQNNLKWKGRAKTGMSQHLLPALTSSIIKKIEQVT